MQRRITWALAIELAMTLTVSAAAQSKPAADPFAGFDQWVTTFMAESHVPGLAFGVVKDGKVLTTRAYGYRNVEEKLPMTPRTVMAIGSITKSFTALLLGMLVDEKKLDWDRPVKNYMPDFELHDAYATDHLTPRDLLTHRSGLPRHDRIWYGRRVTGAELFARLKYLEPSTSLRNRFQYNNLMFMVAGQLAERLTGDSWSRLIRDRFFGPLGMTRSNTSISELTASDEFSYPYEWKGDRTVRIPFRSLDAVPSAGAINASVEDMLKYVQFRLDRAKIGDRTLVSGPVIDAIESPQMALGSNEQFEYPSYGMGVYVITYRGHPMIHHAGGIDGFTSHVTWMPKDGVGLIVLTNAGDGVVPGLVQLEIVDRVLGLPAIDRATMIRKVRADDRARAAEERRQHQAARVNGAPASHDLSAYTGRYVNPAYGTMTVELRNGALELRFDDFALPLEHYHYDVFEIAKPDEDDPFSGPIQFRTNAKGAIDTLLIPFEPRVEDIIFTRQ